MYQCKVSANGIPVVKQFRFLYFDFFLRTGGVPRRLPGAALCNAGPGGPPAAALAVGAPAGGGLQHETQRGGLATVLFRVFFCNMPHQKSGGRNPPPFTPAPVSQLGVIGCDRIFLLITCPRSN